MGEPQRVVGVKLKESDLAVLNLRLQSLGYDSLSHLVHGIISTDFSNEKLVDALAEKVADLVAEKVNQRLTIDRNRVTVPSTFYEGNVVGRGGFEPPTFAVSERCPNQAVRIEVATLG